MENKIKLSGEIREIPIKTRKICKLYDVYIYSQGMKITMLSEVSKHEAVTFCEENNWCYKDENDFIWDMDYEEI